jgi:hypothetical protein
MPRRASMRCCAGRPQRRWRSRRSAAVPTAGEARLRRAGSAPARRQPAVRRAGRADRRAEKNRELTYKNRYPDLHRRRLADPDAQPRQGMGTDVRIEHPAAAGVAPFAGTRGGKWLRPRARARRRRQSGAPPIWRRTCPAGFRAAPGTTGRRPALLPQAELAFKAALAGYETGKLDFATLLDAQRQIRKAKQDRLKAQAERRFAWPKSNDCWEKNYEQGGGIGSGLAVAAALPRRRLLARQPRRPWRRSSRRSRGERRQEGTQAALLPQPDGPAGHLADAEERPDGHGLHPGL